MHKERDSKKDLNLDLDLDKDEEIGEPAPVGQSSLGKLQEILRPPRMRWFAAFLVILTVAFGWPLGLLAVHAANSNLHSHILLIPFICIYLLHMKWPELPRDYQTSPGWAALPIVGGCGALAAAVVAVFGEGTLPLSHNDRLALVAFSFFCFLWAGGFLFLGRNWVAQAAFPLGFFLFLVPLPDGFVNWAENGLVLGSAEATDLFYRLSGTPVFREGTIFQLPGIVLEVARECSGIRSTWVLVITSLLASYLFLKNPWHRAVLVALVIPLGILRNGFRILVIGLLCVHIGPEMIDSIVHKKGGPLFFALSLVPLFAVAWWLSRRERKE